MSKDAFRGTYAAPHIQNIGSATGGNCAAAAPSRRVCAWGDGPRIAQDRCAFTTPTATQTDAVPDGGSTLALLGAALSGLALLRRALWQLVGPSMKWLTRSRADFS